MARFNLALRAFNGGEVSPRLEGRSDLGAGGASYLASARRLENFIPLVQGSLIHRPGLRFVKAVKTSADQTWLIPFTVSTIAAYVIEAGDLYFRFYTSEARLENPPGTPVEVVTPYAKADLPNLQYAQSADTLYIVHPSYAPRKLTRTSATAFALNTITFLDGPYLAENLTTAHIFTAAAASGATTITASGAGNTPFLAGRDEGRHIRMRLNTQVGWATITSVSSSTVVNVTWSGGTGTTTGVSTWTLGAWYIGNYPRTVTFHEQRLCFAGAPNAIQRIDCSVTGDYERFSPSGSVDTSTAYNTNEIFDDDAISYTIGSNELNAILWMRVHHSLICGTSQSLFTLSASSLEEALTPTNVNVREEDMTGSASIQPTRMANTIIFSGRANRSIHTAGESTEDTGTVATDVTELADHLMKSGVRQLQAARDPIPIVWACNANGELCSFTFKPSHRVFAWARHPIGGSVIGSDQAVVRSLAIIPVATHDQLWLIVERRINGSTVQYVEFLEDPFRFFDEDQPIEDAFFLDSAISYDTPLTMTGATQANPVVVTSASHGLSNGDLVRITEVIGMTELNGRTFQVANAALNTFELQTVASVNVNGTAYTAYLSGGEIREKASTFSGLTHLEGQTVGVLADGAPVPDEVVSGGAIALASAASHVHVGLKRSAIYESLRLETPDQENYSQGKHRSIDRCTFRLFDSLGGKIGPSTDKLVPILYRTPTDPMNEAPPLFTGEKEVSFPGGWTQEPRLVLVQDEPLPFTWLSAGLMGEGSTR